MKSKQKQITGWSLFSFLLCLNAFAGFGVWTIFLLGGALFFIPPVFNFINKKMKIKKSAVIIVSALLIVVGAVFWCVKGDFDSFTDIQPQDNITQSTIETTEKTTSSSSISETTPDLLDNIPDYSGKAYIIINNNVPDLDKNAEAKGFEKYAPLDKYGRCVEAYACVCKETMPTEKRGEIYSVKPSGWQHIEYDFVDGRSLYNRCHLIGFQLTAENANERNLITGTRYMNTEGMLPFENMVSDYVKETNNHVLYRVTPIFKGTELVARGVQMEAYSVEDNGEGVCYNVFCYNVQPGVIIDYKDGKSTLKDSSKTTTLIPGVKKDYILNKKSYKFHLPECPGISDMNPSNKASFKGTREELINQGYKPCGVCNP